MIAVPCWSSWKTGIFIVYEGRPGELDPYKAKFANKYNITFPLLADADHEIAEKYGVWQQKSFMGRKFMGIVRTTYLIGPDGKVQQRWDNVKVDEHADEVLDALS